MSNQSILERTRKAIFDVFGEYISEDAEKAKEIINKSTCVGADDPGEWSPNAAVIIYCESGVPSGSFNPKVFEYWFEVTDLLKTHYCEHINAAVIGVYK
ncbi:hypothetical protein LCGC14_0941680 [marine sediment metagenome]|uniref:Uncharacterized protein n=1 Tax=marine sediment metagenome TaxID=412755 RepID=A0A0F9P611_9ZZZZ